MNLDKENEIRQNKLRDAKREKNYRADVIKVFLVMAACLVLLVVVIYGILLLYEKLTSFDGTIKEDGSREVISTEVVYTADQVEQRVTNAVSEAHKAGEDKILNALKNGILEGRTMIDILRDLYPDNLVVASGGQYHFVPINKELKQNTLTRDNLVILENGEYQYVVGNKVMSYKGIDVSSHQGDIDWMQVAEDGVEFAFIRVGFRGYGKEGNLMEDEKFDQNIMGAQEAGIKVGVYMFSQAITEEELQEEVDLVLNKIAPYQLDCPVVFDVEMISGDGRANALSLEDRTNLTLSFCEAIEREGYIAMVYHNTEMGAVKIDIASLENYDKWYASYSDKMFYPYEYKVWQYSEKGTVAGINGNVDMNISIGKIWR